MRDKRSSWPWCVAWWVAPFIASGVARAGTCPQNLVPNPLFAGTGGMAQGVIGQVPNQWRGFAVGGGAAELTIVPVAANALYAGSPAAQGVKLKVTSFGTDQGFDHDGAHLPIQAGASYHFEVYVKTANTNGGNQKFNVSFPLFDAGGFLGREPGGQGNLTATGSWKKFVGPTFSDPDATSGHLAFRLINDAGEDAILIALPTVDSPSDLFALPTPAQIAQRESWSPADRLIGTTYFYWYRWPDLHFFDDAGQTDDALTDHFADPAAVSMESVSWHKGQLEDMIEAGIDMLWPVYWAAPGNFDVFPFNLYVEALCPLQEAADALLAEGKSPPKIGLFYDTTSLLNSIRFASPPDGMADLTTPEGKDIFYQTIRSFFTAVHPKHWACLDGRPIVVLYSAGFAENYNQSSFDYVYTQFAADFDGVVPYIIRENSWSAVTDSYYRWGGALNGPYFDGIAAIGPGYDDSAVPGRTTPVRKRDDGAFYRSAWQQLLGRPQTIVHIETWSEYHEGTEIAETLEYGRKYIEMTALYGQAWKLGLPASALCLWECGGGDPPPPDLTDGQEYAEALEVELRAQAGEIITDGLDADGALTLADVSGSTYLRSDLGGRNRYAQFKLKDPFYYDQQRGAEIELEYLDQGFGDVIPQYDSYDAAALCCGTFRQGPKITLTNSGVVKTAILTLDEPRFANRQVDGTDFRFYVEIDPLYVKRLTVRVLPMAGALLRVTNVFPAPGESSSGRPPVVLAEFDGFPVPETVNASTFRLVRSGGDGVFDNGNDVEIVDPSRVVSGSAALLDLAGLVLPGDVYQIVLAGRGEFPIRNVQGNPLDGKFTGVFPSGDGTGGGDFVSTFTVPPPRGDLDNDGDADGNDFLTFSNCFNGSLNPPSPTCAAGATDFDGDGDVDGNDFLTFSNCFNGSLNPSNCP